MTIVYIRYLKFSSLSLCFRLTIEHLFAIVVLVLERPLGRGKAERQMHGTERLDQAIEILEMEAANLDPELMTVADARERLTLYLRLQEAAAVGWAALARVWGDET